MSARIGLTNRVAFSPLVSPVFHGAGLLTSRTGLQQSAVANREVYGLM